MKHFALCMVAILCFAFGFATTNSVEQGKVAYH